MDKYLPQKAIPVDLDEKAREQADFIEKMKRLKNAPVEMNSDLAQKVAKDLPVDKIDTRQSVKITSAPDFAAQKIINEANSAARKTGEVVVPDNSYDAGAMKKEYEQMKRAESDKKIYGTKAPVDLDYNSFRKTGLRKLAAAVPLLGTGLAGLAAINSPDASAGVMDAIIPGGLESTGPLQGSFEQRLESGQLTEQDKLKLRQEQSRIKALQSLGKP